MNNQPDVERLERAARNQSLFREVNERLQELATTFEDIAGTPGVFSCECADVSCAEQVKITMDEYEAIRKDPNNFLVLAGHVFPDVEYIVREGEGFVVVAKIGQAATIAAEADPRS